MTCVKNYTNWDLNSLLWISVPDTDATIAVYEGSTDTVITYSVPLIPVKATGTGDIFTSVLSGAIMRGFTVHEAAQLAMNFTTKSIKATVDNAKTGHETHGIALNFRPLNCSTIQIIRFKLSK
ncbi:MAG: hypothetical protein ACLTJ8_04000 [Veillonella atypica]